MDRTELRRLWTSIIVLGIIAAIRIAFFAAEGAQDIIDRMFSVFVFVASYGVLLGWAWIKRKHIRRWFETYREKRWFALFILLMEIMFFIKTGIMPSLLYPFAVALSIVVFVTLSSLLPEKASRILDIAWMVIFFLYVLGQNTYYRIFNDFFSAREIVSAREGFESSESMFRFEWYLVIATLTFFLCLYLYLKEKTVTRLRFRSSMLIVPGLLFACIQFNAHIPKTPERIYASEHYAYWSLFHKETMIHHFGMLHYALRDLSDSMVPPIGTPWEKRALDAYFDASQKSFETHALTHLFQGKNLVYVLAESYDEIALSEALTPNLYRLKTEGIDFTNHYTPVFQRTTSDTEFILNTGQIPSIEDGPTSGMFRRNSYRTSMAHLFSEAGYQTLAFHGNYKEFYGRHILYQGYGYDAIYGQHELGLSEADKRFDTLFYASVKPFFESMEQPFMTMFLTFSGHSPYTLSNKPSMKHLEDVNLYYGDSLPLEVKHYIATQVELDQMIGMLISDLNAAGILDDTVIILSGDHYPYTMYPAYYEEISGKQALYRKQQGNLYMWSPSVSSRKISHLSSSFDILPMIISLFGLSGDAKSYVGTDILNGASTYVYFKNYTVYDGNRLLVMHRKDETDVTLLRQAHEAYKISRMLLRNDYFKVD